eukprot:7354951-Pyramimonas_sp.AAC.1
MPPEALAFNSEHSHASKELYEGPGGDQVGGSPPLPVSRRAPQMSFEEFQSLCKIWKFVHLLRAMPRLPVKFSGPGL